MDRGRGRGGADRGIGLSLFCLMFFRDPDDIENLFILPLESNPKCCTLTWWGGLRALVTLEAISAGTEVPGRFNLAGQVPAERSDELQHLAPAPGWGLGEGPITLPCKNYLLRKPQSGRRG